MTVELLPDCRTRETKGRVFTAAGIWLPVFCGNCGIEGGLVPEDNMTFIFWLCNECFKTHGEVAGTMSVPDQVFFDKIKEEQIEAYGRYLSHEEMVNIAQEDSSALATLLKEAK